MLSPCHMVTSQSVIREWDSDRQSNASEEARDSKWFCWWLWQVVLSSTFLLFYCLCFMHPDCRSAFLRLVWSPALWLESGRVQYIQYISVSSKKSNKIKKYMAKNMAHILNKIWLLWCPRLPLSQMQNLKPCTKHCVIRAWENPLSSHLPPWHQSSSTLGSRPDLFWACCKWCIIVSWL